MRFRLGCRLGYRTTNETTFIFNVEAQQSAGQVIEEERLEIAPTLRQEQWQMPETGNRYLRVTASPGELIVKYEAVVSLTPSLEDPNAVTELNPSNLPLNVFPYLNPSRYCQSDKLDRFARSTFGALQPGYTRVNGICNWIYDYVSYEGGVSDAMTSAFDTVTQRAGVCRDFAHLGIALCRTMNIPARYVSAYAFRLNPPDFHAVFEAFLQGPNGPGWYLFDPTRMSDPAGLVRIGVGRDAADVAFGSAFGAVSYDIPQVHIEADGEQSPATTQAIRLG
ncbi:MULTISPECIES: transglutaminase family protein [unclassified Acidisoma]|jgi:transglutaminase-like putative cysteine protease|uniref:transglutaminase-like domain-containing protein n=1 Tax=unclassified Acidisoma TaxID=2634065 RepID=UPI00131B9877|nr:MULTISPECIES: transglutaminase family protein [unclassified Acidisoma]